MSNVPLMPMATAVWLVENTTLTFKQIAEFCKLHEVEIQGIADGKGKNLYKIMGKKYFNKKTFPYSKKINFNSLRRGEVVGEHEVKFSSGKEIITLNHEAFDRALYSEGALTAAKWLINKKPGLYSMRDVLNFK